MPQAQKISKVYNNKTALIEIVKYGSKIFTEPDLNKKIKAKDTAKIYSAALDNIFNAMKGLRIFERFGFNLPPMKVVKPGRVSVVKEYEEWNFDIKQFDWLNTSDRKLTDFQPLAKLLELLEEKVDVLLE